MKIIKKIAAIMLSVMMVLGMCSVVGAEEASGSYEDDNGKITIQNAKKNQTYTIYRILKLESFSRGDKREEGNYAYTLEEGWDDFLTNSSEYPTGNCLKKDNNTGYVTWDSTKTDYAAFAKDALKYVKAKPIAPAKDAVTPSEDGAVSFEKLPLGYYLIDSTAGALCSLDTTDKEVIIQEKNGVPSVEKKVQEDSTSKWESSNTADIGQIVNFKTTITAQAGAQSYVLHDKMDKGLTFNGDVTVKINKSGTTGETSVDSQNYEVKTEGFSSGDTCTFHVEFKQTFCDNLANGDQIIIYYSAKLNDEAIKYNVVIGIEPNSKDYGTNFLTNTKDTFEFVKKINLKNIKINLDLSTIILENENISQSIDLVNSLNYNFHCHISIPYLKNNYIDYKNNLIEYLYKLKTSKVNYCSIETVINNNNEIENINAINEIIDFIKSVEEETI